MNDLTRRILELCMEEPDPKNRFGAPMSVAITLAQDYGVRDDVIVAMVRNALAKGRGRACDD